MIRCDFKTTRVESNLVGRGRPISFCIGHRVLNLFCASAWQLYSTEVELFVLIESSYNVDFALQFGKAWNRSLVGGDFCNTFVLIRDSGLCLL